MKNKALSKISHLFRKSHSARLASATTVGAAGTSLGASGDAGESSTASAPNDSVEFATIRRLDTLLQASQISGDALVTTSEALKALDAILSNINSAENDCLESDAPTLDRLLLHAEQFTNSSWPSNLTWMSPVTTPEIKEAKAEYADQETANPEDIVELMQLAAQASYHVRIRPDIAQDVKIDAVDINAQLESQEQGIGAGPGEIRLPRADIGLFKPTDVKFVMESIDGDDGGTVVCAIRGSKTWMDWLVNFDSGLVNAENLLGIDRVKAHAGLYAVARLMLQPTLDALKKQIGYPECLKNTGKKPRLLFTGHSAGGAVAALIWRCALVNRYKSRLEGDENFATCFRSMHCITFGAPPISEPCLSGLPKIDPNDENDILLSIVNEGDPVPRADFAYTMALLQLYTRGSPDPDTMGTGKLLKLPPMGARSAGICGFRVVEPSDDQPTVGYQVRLVEVKQEIMEKTIAANPLAHQMGLYATNVASYAKSHIESLRKKVYNTRILEFETLPTVGAEAAAAGPTFGGFKAWWQACDLDSQEKWCVSSVADGNWTYVSYMFGLGSPTSGQESVDAAIKRIMDNMADREIV